MWDAAQADDLGDAGVIVSECERFTVFDKSVASCGISYIALAAPVVA